MVIHPSDVWKTSYGELPRCDCPSRAGRPLVANTCAASYTLNEIAEARRATSTFCPLPDRCRACTAHMIPKARCIPAATSEIAIGSLKGGPSAGPHKLINPDIPWVMRSNPPLGLYGPVCPKPEME